MKNGRQIPTKREEAPRRRINRRSEGEGMKFRKEDKESQGKFYVATC